MTQAHQDFLFEIGTEELPAKQLIPLKNALLEEVLKGLNKAGLPFTGKANVFASPRRLAILIEGLATQQADQTLEKKGPNLVHAFDAEGKPTKACEGFAKSCNLSVAALEKRETEQGTFLFALIHNRGKATRIIMPTLMTEALAKLPIAKPMRWGTHPTSFLRPVRWCVMLLGAEIIPAQFFGLNTHNQTYGHRFMAPQALTIHKPGDYEDLLYTQGKVIADFDKRKSVIEVQLKTRAASLDATLQENEALLDEVAGLVEWPVTLIANFDKRFLSVPENALIAAMESHQKSFAIRDKQQKLFPHFLTVSNIESKDPSTVIVGNERVMNARLSDAEFFFSQDLKAPLESYLADLQKVVFQRELGSLYDKTLGLEKLSGFIADKLGSNVDLAKQAARLAKCDLRTHMVGEFPELQGEMGEIYALKQNVPPSVASALFQQYLPRFAKDALPDQDISISLALADRLLNLVGLFGVGQIPTGDKDPFALRRAAIGVCRIMIKLPKQQLMPWLLEAQHCWEQQGICFTTTDTIDQVFDFIMERLRHLYLEEDYSPFVIQAVLSLKLDDLQDINARIKAIAHFNQSLHAEALKSAQKRVKNLLDKEKLLIEDLLGVDPNLFELTEEKTLANAIIFVKPKVDQWSSKQSYIEALQEMSALKTPIDDFFDKVMIMVDDKKLKHNRLCLLAELYQILNQVADISRL